MREWLRTVRSLTTLADRLVFATILLLSAGAAFAARSGFEPAREAVVTIDRKPVFSLRFDQEGEYTIPAPLGPVVVQVHGGKIRVVRSSCPDKVCVYERPVTPLGGIIVCAPNRLVIQVHRGSVSSLDCVTQ